MRWEVVVVGAGAAGLLAAARAAERGRRVLLLEKNRKPGVKILMSGGTRCNLTQATGRRGIVGAFGKPGRFLHSALAAFGPADLVALIESEGVATKVEPSGKVFPASDKAADVLGALLARLHRSGCTLALEEPVTDITRSSSGFAISTSQRTLAAGKVIVTTGGCSYPRCGTSGDGYAWLAGMGHTIVPPRPALTPLTTTAPWVGPLRGVTVPDVAVRVVAEGGPNPICGMHVLAEAHGAFLFTHFGLSGPAVLDVSRAVTRRNAFSLHCDFLPALRPEELDDYLRRRCSAEGSKYVLGIVPRQIARRLAATLLELTGLAGLRCAELTRSQRRRLTAAIKRTCIPISGTCGFEKAEVTAGGVALDQIDSATMQSKIVPDLFPAGEILDLDGPIGGYNFQAAFSTAWLAGSNV